MYIGRIVFEFNIARIVTYVRGMAVASKQSIFNIMVL